MRIVRLWIAFICLLGAFSAAYAMDPNTTQGKEKAAPCAVCHGLNGNSTVPMVPVLAQQQAAYLVKQLLDYRLGLRKSPIMQPLVAGLTDADILNISQYFANETALGGVAQRPYYALGFQLYRGGIRERNIPACSACHGPTGSGNNEARFPALSGQHMAYTVQQLNAFKNGERQNGPNHIMGDIARRMTEEDIQAVASYVAGLHE